MNPTHHGCRLRAGRVLLAGLGHDPRPGVADVVTDRRVGDRHLVFLGQAFPVNEEGLPRGGDPGVARWVRTAALAAEKARSERQP